MKRHFFENNKLVYIPAVLPSQDLYKKTLNGKTPTTWTDNGVGIYNNMLLSAYHAIKEPNMRKKMNIRDDVMVLGDSGGFQLVTLGGKIDAKEVIKWQVDNCNAGLILDRPPYHFGNSANFSGTPTQKFLEECLQTTINNAKIALQYLKETENTNFRLYGVIQGETFEQMMYWGEQMRKIDIGFHGWALSPKPSYDEIKIALMYITYKELGLNTPMHILQVTSKGGILIAAYMRKLSKKTITIDSSSFTSGARYGCAISPFDLGNIYVGNFHDIDKDWICGCQVCENIDFTKKTKSIYLFINIHNLMMTAQYVKYADSLVEMDIEEFESSIKKISKNCIIAYEMLKTYNIYGLKICKNRFGEYFKGETTTQQTVFDF